MLTTIGLGRRIPSQPDSTSIPIPQQTTSVIPKSHQRTSSSSITDDSEKATDSVNIAYRTRHCYSPLRPNSLILSSSQNSSQKNPNEQINDDENEKYYSAQSSKLSTPMVHPTGLSSFIRKNSEDKLPLSSILDMDNEEQKKHQTKVLPSQK
jgi:hypothetical protein